MITVSYSISSVQIRCHTIYLLKKFMRRRPTRSHCAQLVVKKYLIYFVPSVIVSLVWGDQTMTGNRSAVVSPFSTAVMLSKYWSQIYDVIYN